MMEEKEKDPLRDLFAHLPDSALLPADFAARTMERIYSEARQAEARRRRWERIGMAVLFALPVVALIVMFLVLKITLPWPDFRTALPDMAACRFYFYIGMPVFLLWTADAFLRRFIGRSIGRSRR